MSDPALDLSRTTGTRFADGLTMDKLLYALEQGQVFSAIKLCHGFWERCVHFEKSIRQLGLEHPLSEQQWETVLSGHPVNWPVELFLEVKDYLSRSHEYPDVLAMVSPYAWDDGYAIEGTPIVGLDETEAAIRAYMSPRTCLHDGLFWKNSIHDGSFVKFLRRLEDRPTLIAGPEYVRNFAEFAHLKDSDFIPVHAKKAAWERRQILETISEKISSRWGEGVVCLIESGGVTSTWLVHKLAARFPKSCFFALGQALNICNFEYLRNINWYLVHHRKVNDSIHAINPRWVVDERAYGEQMKSMLKKSSRLWHVQRRNYEAGLYRLLEDAVGGAVEADALPAGFIGQKQIDQDLVSRIRSLSERPNLRAGLSPVSQLLERSVHRLLSLPDDKQPVMCKSATDATLTLVRMHDHKAGRKLKWVVSAFGSFGTHLGRLADATVVDCDPSGMLDLQGLKALPAESWDGIIVTNPFSLADNLNGITEYAGSLSKHVIVDNAAAMFTASRQRAGYPAEVISFHRTKPWGMSEGGCAILDESEADVFRSLTRSGAGLDPRARRFATNSDLSDFDAALILQRLINLPNWLRLYQMQQRRILAIAGEAGLAPLKPIPKEAVMAYVPLLAARPVSNEELVNPLVTLRKYYQPLVSGCENAQRLFDRIICMPCHPQVSGCDAGDLRRLLAQFAK